MELALVKCNAISGILASAQQIETVLSLNEFLMIIIDQVLYENHRSRGGFLRAANRLLGQLGSQQIIRLLGNGGL